MQAADDGGSTVLRWTAARESDLYSYEVRRDGRLISPVPLRAAAWVDAGPPPGRHTYGVRAVSASGIAGPETLHTVLA